MTDPLKEIEDKQSQVSIGRVAYRVYSGARLEGAGRLEAIDTTIAWLKAAWQHNAEANPSEEEGDQ